MCFCVLQGARILYGMRASADAEGGAGATLGGRGAWGAQGVGAGRGGAKERRIWAQVMGCACWLGYCVSNHLWWCIVSTDTTKTKEQPLVVLHSPRHRRARRAWHLCSPQRWKNIHIMPYAYM